MSFRTADLCDEYDGKQTLQIAEPILRAFGGHSVFKGIISGKCLDLTRFQKMVWSSKVGFLHTNGLKNDD